MEFAACPIAVYGGGRYSPFGADAESLIAPPTRFAIFEGGKRIGTFRTVRMGELGYHDSECAFGRIKLSGGRPLRQRIRDGSLYGTLCLRAGRASPMYSEDPLGPEGRTRLGLRLIQAAKQHLSAEGITKENLVLSKMHCVRIAGQDCRMAAGNVGWGKNTVFLIWAKRKAAPGQLYVHYYPYDPAKETDRQVESFVDFADVDEDGLPEIVTRVVYYEGYHYQIYSYTDAGFKEVFGGGGGGG